MSGNIAFFYLNRVGDFHFQCIFIKSLSTETCEVSGSCLNVVLTFEEHSKLITTKVSKTIGLLRILQKTLSRLVLMTMYKAFVRPHLHYGDIIYDEAYNETFHQKFESI